MSGFKFVQPDGPLYRLARAPNPWTWPDWAYAGLDGTFGNRWDWAIFEPSPDTRLELSLMKSHEIQPNDPHFSKHCTY